MVAASPNDRHSLNPSDPAFIELLSYSAKALNAKTSSAKPLTKKGAVPRLPASSKRPSSHPSVNPTLDQPEDSAFADLIFGYETNVDETTAQAIHAAPLPALRDRDLIALAELFQIENMPAIEADILESLALRYPEPCWEDTPFDFLRDFL